jgi:hypothetical protein
MFSDHTQQPDEPSHKVWLGVAAGQVIVCQLVPMALVVDGQVERAHARGFQYAAERSALAQCNQSSLGTERQNCVLQAQTAANFPQQTASPQAVADATGLDGAFQSTALLTGR